MAAYSIFQEIFSLFLILFVGFFSKKLNLIDQYMTKKLSTFLLYVTMPLLIITSFNLNYTNDMMKKAIIVFLSSIAIHLLGIGFTKIMYYKNKEKPILSFATIFSNCGFIGFPLLYSIYGKEGVFYASMYNVGFNLFIFTYGVSLFHHDDETYQFSFKKLLSPGIIAVLIGMTIFVLNIRLPYILDTPLSLVGSMTTPLSLIIIGAILADIELKTIFNDWNVYYGSLLKLIVFPLLVYGIMSLLHIDSFIIIVSVILVGMPAAANTVIFAEQYDGDSHFASKIIALSTLASIFTLPLLLFIIS